MPFAIFFMLFMLLDADLSLERFLKNSQWKQRVLLIYSPTDTDSILRQQRALLQPETDNLQERQVVVRELLAFSLSATDKAYLAEKLRVTGQSFMVVLIGKDGGVKIRQTTPLRPQKLYETIDSMPMRQVEMKKGQP